VFERHWADEAMSQTALSEAEALLADMLADAYAAEHPELLGATAPPSTVPSEDAEEGLPRKHPAPK
jgi:hypothetical protein